MKAVRDVRVRGAIGVVELDRITDLNDLERRFVEWASGWDRSATSSIWRRRWRSTTPICTRWPVPCAASSARRP